MAKASSVTKVTRSDFTNKAKDRIPEGRGFVASSKPAGGERPASVQRSQNGSESRAGSSGT